jgi:hypothetical protein
MAQIWDFRMLLFTEEARPTALFHLKWDQESKIQNAIFHVWEMQARCAAVRTTRAFTELHTFRHLR